MREFLNMPICRIIVMILIPIAAAAAIWSFVVLCKKLINKRRGCSSEKIKWA